MFLNSLLLWLITKVLWSGATSICDGFILMDGGSSIHCESGTISFLSSLPRKYIFNFFFLANLFCIQAWAFICGKQWQQIYVYSDLFYRISKMFQKTTSLASIENRTFTFFKVQNIFERSKYSRLMFGGHLRCIFCSPYWPCPHPIFSVQTRTAIFAEDYNHLCHQILCY